MEQLRKVFLERFNKHDCLDYMCQLGLEHEFLLRFFDHLTTPLVVSAITKNQATSSARQDVKNLFNMLKSIPKIAKMIK